jgi:pimeloyl-ACP methyl ester carboxylesterase
MEKVGFVRSGDGQKIYFKFYPEKRKPPLLFLHGLGANHTYWIPLARILRAYGFPVVLVDMRGHGHSASQPNGEFTLSRLDDDTNAVLRRLEFKDPVIIGLSSGGMSALHYSLSHEVRALILIGATPLPFLKSLPIDIDILRAPSRGLLYLLYHLRRLDHRKTLPYISYPNLRNNSIIGCFFQNLRGTRLDAYASSFLPLLHFDISKRLHEIKPPCFCLAGSTDWVFRPSIARYIAENVRQGEWKIVPNMHHEGVFRQPKPIAREILHFLKKI